MIYLCKNIIKYFIDTRKSLSNYNFCHPDVVLQSSVVNTSAAIPPYPHTGLGPTLLTTEYGFQIKLNYKFKILDSERETIYC
jgi:hypothetical protein